MQYLHQYGEEYEERGNEKPGVFLYPEFVVGGHEGTVFQSFDEHEVDDGCSSDTAEQSDSVFQFLCIIKCEEKTGEILY